MKIISWNVNGLRAVVQKNFMEVVRTLDPEILCLQETKAQDDQVAEALAACKSFRVYSNSAEKKGYSGTAILSKTEPIRVFRDMGKDKHDREGRILGMEFGAFYLVNVYVPNSGNDLKKLGYRQQWDLDFFHFLKKLEKEKPVVVCGDFNVAHKDVDLARPKANYNKTAGYTQDEIDGMDRFVQGGFVDTFRHFHPGKTGAYSWWSYRAGAREKNVGWRIDYFLVSPSLISSISGVSILNEIMGSDHCPVGIELNLNNT